MMRNGFINLMIPLLILGGCSNDDESNSNAKDLIIFTTTNMNIADVFIDLQSGEEVTAESDWHLSIQKDTDNYNMPSIIFSNVQVAIYNDLLFEEIDELPTNFTNNEIDDMDSFGYSGVHEILSYDITVHQVSVSNPDYVYILKFQDGVVYKLQFLDYQGGITVFHYESIN